MKCKQCGNDSPAPNFSLKTGTGDGHIYRSEICRKCERNNKKQQGSCMCGLPLIDGKSGCERCLRIRRESVKRRSQKDRSVALTHYGGKCAICGETLEIFLTIDHINNDGAEHRKKINGHNHGGVDMGAWLRRNNYPDGFQVLCVNCNHAKGRIGETALRTLLREAGRIT